MKKTTYKILILTIFLFTILINNFKIYADSELNIDAKAVIAVEKNTGKVIFEKDSKIKKYPASVTKVLTAILVLENCQLDDIVTVSKTAVNIPTEYVVAPIYIGEKITVKDLLYALMLKSANDAAYALAEHVGGSIDGFSKMMNEKAKELGCQNTHFVNPNGIQDENHYTTAYDLYLMSKYAMKNETFAKIVSTYEYTLEATNKYSKNDRVMTNTNSFLNPNSKLYNENIKGIKTGTTLLAGNCLITDIAKDGFEYIIVVLGAKTSDGRFTETNKIMNYAFKNYEFTKVHKKGDVIKTIEIENATKETKDLNLIIDKEIVTINNIKIEAENIEPKIVLQEEILAPISEGQELGTIDYEVDGLKYSAKLLAQNDVEEKTYYIEIAIGIIVFLIIILILKRIKHRK